MRKLIYADNSGELTESQLVFTGKTLLSKVLVLTDGTNEATVVVYDSLTASGKKMGTWVVSGPSKYGGGNVIPPEKIRIGIYVSISGTGAKAHASWVVANNLYFE